MSWQLPCNDSPLCFELHQADCPSHGFAVAGAHIVISHPMGRAWHTQLKQQQPAITPHQLPDRQGLDKLIEGLPLQVRLTVTQFRASSDSQSHIMPRPPLDLPWPSVAEHAPSSCV